MEYSAVVCTGLTCLSLDFQECNFCVEIFKFTVFDDRGIGYYRSALLSREVFSFFFCRVSDSCSLTSFGGCWSSFCVSFDFGVHGTGFPLTKNPNLNTRRPNASALQLHRTVCPSLNA